MRLGCLLAAVLIAAPSLPAAGPPLRNGERLVYRVSWAILPVAGRITVTGQSTAEPDGTPVFSAITETETRGLARLILPFSARAQSVYAVPSGALLFYAEASRTRDKQAYHSMTFDYANRTVAYLDRTDPQKSRTLDLPPGEPMDLIDCLLSARSWHLRPGQSHDVLCFFEDQFYPLTIHAIGEEVVDTPLGLFNTVVLEPRMEHTPPKGMFRKGGAVRVWIARDDPRQLPVQFQVQFKFGAGVATLSDYRPGAAAAVPPTVRAPAGRR